ncbi:hypothetical protein [Campylobacter sp. 19-13652]|uniref:hypothetical protein n=1 Tax=Campylobacter sp. 19-13652 TaxID=2840180 RepID=UPI001C792E9C|nr:hypothetical protein [Campylobacter sp. 19-13652]BCX79937.1 hypothetical protein LBC_13990 [Campylobacter sp. 19-13652]
MKKALTLSLLATLAFGFSFDLSYQNAPISPTLSLGAPLQTLTLKLENDNPITGADYEPESGKWTLSSRYNELYITDDKFINYEYLKHDRHFIMEMEDSVGASWVKTASSNQSEAAMISYNKTFVSYEYAPNLSPDEQNEQWKHLLSGYDKFKLSDMANKGRFSTIRAKQQYILGWDYEPKSNKFIIASVPDNLKPSWSIAEFDGDDKLPLAEYIPALSQGLSLKDGKGINSYYITGIDASKDAIYLLSKNYSSVLVLNPDTHKIDAAYGFSGVANPQAIALKDEKIYIFSREGDENRVFVFAAPKLEPKKPDCPVVSVEVVQTEPVLDEPAKPATSEPALDKLDEPAPTKDQILSIPQKAVE